MRTFISVIIYVLALHLSAQEDKTINWINENAIKIEDANPDTQLSIFNANVPKKFAKAQIFGFGEASHHGKEFFNIKDQVFQIFSRKTKCKSFYNGGVVSS